MLVVSGSWRSVVPCPVRLDRVHSSFVNAKLLMYGFPAGVLPTELFNRPE